VPVSAGVSEEPSRSRGRVPSLEVPATAVVAVLLIASVIVFALPVPVLENGLAAARKSAYTQAHGLSRTATVISVTSNGSKSGTEDVAASLAGPTDGDQSITIYVPSTQLFSPGTTAQILIDPHDPGYAELPGQRFSTVSTAWGTATAWWVIAAFVSFLMIFAARELRKEHHRTASPSAATGTPLPAALPQVLAWIGDIP